MLDKRARVTAFFARDDVLADLENWFNRGKSDTIIAQRFCEKLLRGGYDGFRYEELLLTPQTIGTMRMAATGGRLTRLDAGRAPPGVRRAPSSKPAHVSFTALLAAYAQRGNGCPWPRGDLGDPAFHFCGKKLKKGSPYCWFHAIRLREPGTGWSSAELERLQRLWTHRATPREEHEAPLTGTFP